MGYADVIAWSVAIFGGLVVLLAATPTKVPRTPGSGIATGFVVATSVGLLLVVPAVFLNSWCIEFGWCASRGDGNMSFWFHSVFAIPIYWFLFAAVSTMNGELRGE
jgi:hypothetical protein